MYSIALIFLGLISVPSMAEEQLQYCPLDSAKLELRADPNNVNAYAEQIERAALGVPIGQIPSEAECKKQYPQAECQFAAEIRAQIQLSTNRLTKAVVDNPFKLKGVLRKVSKVTDHLNWAQKLYLEVGAASLNISFPTAILAQKAFGESKISSEVLIIEPQNPSPITGKVPLTILSDRDRKLIEKRLASCQFTDLPKDIRQDLNKVDGPTKAIKEN